MFSCIVLLLDLCTVTKLNELHELIAWLVSQHRERHRFETQDYLMLIVLSHLTCTVSVRSLLSFIIV